MITNQKMMQTQTNHRMLTNQILMMLKMMPINPQSHKLEILILILSQFFRFYKHHTASCDFSKIALITNANFFSFTF